MICLALVRACCKTAKKVFFVYFFACILTGGNVLIAGLRIMNESIEDLTVNYEENGQLLIKELGKAPLSKGAWTTILFRYQEWRPESDDYGPDKFVIHRYKKSGGEYRRQNKFNISSVDQARKIVDALSAWID